MYHMSQIIKVTDITSKMCKYHGSSMKVVSISEPFIEATSVP